ncbi:MAG TPA: 1-(5-phosphoribosyl)-5-[(5-phosphoribosylamino)methylideneamino] imidazole-4-carboxamide isomerase [Terriglobales bacterium]
MLIPSIDIMGGKIVQLVQGEKKVLESSDFNYWIHRFVSFPLVQLIDLDAAMNQGANSNLVAMICGRLPCQVGGGIRSVEQASELLSLGARRVIFGSALLKDGGVNILFADQCAQALGADRLTFAVDSRGGKVAIQGWKETTEVDPAVMMRQLEGRCAAFLYTHIDSEGTLSGFPLSLARTLRHATSRRLIVAGGIRSLEEVQALDAFGVDAVVGMAIYAGKIH